MLEKIDRENDACNASCKAIEVKLGGLNVICPSMHAMQQGSTCSKTNDAEKSARDSMQCHANAMHAIVQVSDLNAIKRNYWI